MPSQISRLHCRIGCFVVAVACLASPLPCLAATSVSPFSLRQVLGYTFPSKLTASSHGNKIAWVMNLHGVRNLWVAKAPGFDPVKLTHYTRDDGLALRDLAFSPDGNYLVYVRGGDPDQNWHAKHRRQPNPSSMPHKPRLQLWSVETTGRAMPKRLALDVRKPVVSPDSRHVVYQQIFSGKLRIVPIDGSRKSKQMFWNRGRISDPVWSPDGKSLAFVTKRENHSFIGIYRGPETPIEYLSPSTSWDGHPQWSPDGKSIAFIRRGKLEAHPWSIWVADVATGRGTEIWKAPPTRHGSYPTWGQPGRANLNWVSGHRLSFVAGMDGWWHLYVMAAKPGAKPRKLTSGNYMVEYVRVGPGRKIIYFDANHGPSKLDSDRRHLFSVNVDTFKVSQLTSGTGMEWQPTITGDNQYIAFESSTAHRPLLVGVMKIGSNDVRLLQESLIPRDFPSSELVVPKQVVVESTDHFLVHCQWFASEKTLRDGGKHPAIIYVHGGPKRQMLLGWPLHRYYDNDYAVNQYLASLGFIVLSVNYRDGIGYGWDFSHPRHVGRHGAKEYDDVLAAAKYLQDNPHVDSSRIGIWGGSYGGFLTSYALAKNSDIFAAGVDRHGVESFVSAKRFAEEFFRSQYDPEVDAKKTVRTAWKSSPDAWVSHWTSPVLLIQGDDDRNVSFSHMVGLVHRLRKYHVPFQELVIPDEVHTMLRWESWRKADVATVRFFEQQFLDSK